MICTGRSDFPNQVNNVLCFPYIFRGALDVGATAINEAMKHAAVKAIAALAHEASSDIAAKAYGGKTQKFGADSLIPPPFDQRLIMRIAPAVAKAAMESGVARRPITDFDAYDERLERFVFRSGFVMKEVIERAKSNRQRIVYADGEDERVLRAAEAVLQDKVAVPILIGRPQVIQDRIERFGLGIKPGRDFEVINPLDDPRYRDYVAALLERTARKGVTPDFARTMIRTNTTAIAAIAVCRGDADAMLCGLEGRFHRHLDVVRSVIGLAPQVQDFSTVSMVIIKRGHYFFADTYVTSEPDAENLAEMARMTAGVVERFGIKPKIAMLSHSSFGSAPSQSAEKVRQALAILHREMPDLEVEGELQGDAALDENLRQRIFPFSRLAGEANVFIMPNLDAANIAFHLVKTLSDATPVGPILIGADKPVHILTPSITSRGVTNMTAIAAVDAQERA